MMGFVGEQGAHEPFGDDCPSARRLERMLEVDSTEFQEQFLRWNLWRDGEKLGLVVGRTRVAQLLDKVEALTLPGSEMELVLCGRRVAEAFGYRGVYLHAFHIESLRCVVIPHPSSRNRLWSDPEWERRVGLYLRKRVKHALGL